MEEGGTRRGWLDMKGGRRPKKSTYLRQHADGKWTWKKDGSVILVRTQQLNTQPKYHRSGVVAIRMCSESKIRASSHSFRLFCRLNIDKVSVDCEHSGLVPSSSAFSVQH